MMVRLLLLVVLMGLAGCLTFKGEPDADDPGDLSPAGYWQVKPAAMRIYPSTRFVYEQGQPILEARVEFSDEAGDTVKAVGDFRFELYALDTSGEMKVGRRLYTWEVGMRTLVENRRFYDTITRSYQFRLKLDPASMSADPVMLVVTHIPASGQRLEDRKRLEPTFDEM